MKNLKTILLIGLLIVLCQSILWADISVSFKNTKKTVLLPETKLSGVDYVKADLFNSVFCSIIKEERSDHRLHLYLEGKQFVFLIGSPFYVFSDNSWNMHHPVKRVGDQFYLPSVFVTEQLPLHFKDMDYKNKILSLNMPQDKTVKVIVLDPGHGGQDPGAVGKNKLQEKMVNLKVCLELKKMLEEELGISVLMTRSDDRFISLRNRTKFANDKRADLFVSVHTNSAANRSATGLETYYLSTAQSSDARAVEALENGVVELYEGGKAEKAKYDALSFSLSDLSQTEHLENSNHMAMLIQQNMVAGTQRADRGVKQANFYVLRGAFMPAVLVEVGFISNDREEQLLGNSEYQKRLARTIFEGIKRFKFRYDRIRNV